jgi:hypothetical protein
MNKYQEALGFLKESVCENYFRKQVQTHEGRVTIFKSSEYLQELVDKATPKKPEITIHNGFCPNCHQAFGLERTKEAMLRPRWFSFCPYCGQALDWSEE